MGRKPSLILPVENLVREMDPKLVLACVAAERGFSVTIGSRRQVDFEITRMPHGIYLSKSMTPKSAKIFRILRDLGHAVVVADEESVVYLTPEHYYARRMSQKSLPHVHLLLAWGRDNEELLRGYPGYGDTPIRVVGHPRVDLLRTELRGFYADEVDRLRSEHGRYVLINTNFSMVNGFLDFLNVFREPGSAGSPPALGAAGQGTTPEFARGYAAHKGALFEAFQKLLAPLGEAFPEITFILRPHPGEKHDPWLAAVEGVRNLRVLHEGNVVPWLLGAEALIHNGCTTAVEACVARTPAIAYRPVKDGPFDLDLPNALSHEATTEGEVCEALRGVLRGDLGPAETSSPMRPLTEFLSGLEGELASDRIMDVLESEEIGKVLALRRQPHRYVRGWVRANERAFVKQAIKARVPGHRNDPTFQKHRFPGVPFEDFLDRIARLSRALGRFENVKAEVVSKDIFRVFT